MTNKKIIARFYPQAWIDNSAVTVDPEGDVTWDATRDVLSLELKRIQQLEDDTDASDRLRQDLAAPEWVKTWDGPLYVKVKDCICAFFDVDTLSEITQEMLDSVKQTS